MDASQARARLVKVIQAGAALAAAAMVAGCGTEYRPVVTPINSSGPASQPQSYAVVISAPSPTAPGIATIIDYAGDTILAQAPIGPGPSTFTLDEAGSAGYTLDSDGTLTNFPISSTLQAKNISFSTLSTSSRMVNFFSPSTGFWSTDLNGNVVNVFSGSPQAFKLAIPVAPAPVMITGPAVLGQRDYAISQNLASPTGVECNQSPRTGPLGEADAIEVGINTVSAHIPLGRCPVYGVQNPDTKRFYVLNRGDDTITVINSQNNTLNSCTPFLNLSGQTVTCHPTLPLSTSAVTATGITPPNGTSGMTAIAGPVYAEYNPATSQLIVANYDGNTVSVIDVSMDQYGNDSPTYGTTFTIPVGTNPASVTVLADGSRAYTANQTDGTVTVVNLASHTVEKTLPVNGHPRTVVSTQNSQYGKVYAASPDSPFLTVVRTDLDIVATTILVEGNIVDVRVNSQTGTGGNTTVVSRTPGFGQPCNLPPGLEPAPGAGQTALQVCRTQP